MARRSKYAAEKTRNKILDAAEDCFHERGIAKTTLGMIAERAGCTRGAIYWHFTEKNDLVRQVLERSPLLLLDELALISNGAFSRPIKAMYQCLRRNLEDIQDNIHLRNVIHLLIFQRECTEDLDIKYWQENDVTADFIRILSDIFELAKKRGEINTPVRSETLACIVFYIFSGLVRSYILLPQDKQLFEEGLLGLEFIASVLIRSEKGVE
ncbi:TetR family transcriptional regulator [Samsonia erythrinae]|uniref:TetR family transcriptional regulator n=1 Tax=Samsonia erythrinae TaxID=160434 RepID=A0A4R3VV81_9GAMM|nr:TetR family transcriptional regulator [Samsonia erythrinae]TCV08583.1 TetR family transcriptional regulator [Samsonia erythrinae]